MKKKTKRKLKPYQYKLHLRLPYEPPIRPRTKPYLIFCNGEWYIYRNKWKSQFRGPRLWASCISAPSIRELQARIKKNWDGWKFGANEI